jgi:hypothetical protein
MKQLDSGYTYEVDTIKKDAWHKLLLEFDDTTIYQTWSYGAISWGEESLSHLILLKNGEIVSMAQLRIAKLPLPRIGLAYLTWGPIWRRKAKNTDVEILRNMLRALYNEYAIKRGYLLRVIPKQIHGDEDNIRKIYEDEGFSWSPDPQQTVYVDLTPQLEEIKKNMRPKWRQTLNRALKQQAEFTEESNAELYDSAIKIIGEMMQRKGYVEFGSMEDMISVDQDLPEILKLKIAYCTFENELVAVLGWFPIGMIGVPLVGATGDKALNLNASYPLWWKMVEYYKNQGASCIDLAGINKERNPGGYLFKTGIAGEKRIEKNYIGQFDACENLFSSFCFKTGMSLRQQYRDFIIKMNKLTK